MKDAHQLNMIVKRRVPVPFIEFEQRTLKFTLSKSRKKDDFGIVLGCKYYIKEITNPKLAEKDPGLKEGDVVLRVNGQSLDGVTLEEATRWLQRSREKLSLVVQRDVRRGTPGSRWSSQNTVYERLGSVSATPRHSPTPMHYTQSANPDMINTARKVSEEFGQNSKRYSDPMSRAFEYPPSTQHQQSLPPGYGAPRSPQMGYISNNINNPYCESPRLQNNMFPINNSNQLQQQQQQQQRGPSSQTPSVCSSPRMFGGPQRSDCRVVSFTKGRALGIRVIGGNQVGIFVSAVQDDSPAAMHGIKIGDRLLAVNAYSMERVTREQAVEYLLSVGDEVQLKVESAFEEFLTVRNNQLGDNFYIRYVFKFKAFNKTGNNNLCKTQIFQTYSIQFNLLCNTRHCL
jgi:tight junction protein 1